MTGEPGRGRHRRARPIIPVGGGVPVDEVTGERYGYLPRRASRRKLLIRSQLGLPWLVAAIVFAAVIVAAGVAYLLARPATPGAPYVDQGPLSRYADQDVTPLLDGTGWLDRRSGLSAVGDRVAYCPARGDWVGDRGARFDAQGRRSGGGAGLLRLPVRVADGRVFVDPTGGQRSTGIAGLLPPCPAARAVHEPPPADGL